MYVAKCVNKAYMEKKLGAKVSFIEKFFIGFCLMLFVILLLVGPFVLFSQLNPIAVVNQISGATMRLDLSLSDSGTGTN